MEHSLKMLTMAVGIIITCALISFAMLCFNESVKLGKNVLADVEKISTEYAEYDYEKLDGTISSGGEVVRVITSYQNTIPIVVINGNHSETYNGNFKREDNTSDKSGYISLSASYSGRVKRDDKGRISEIIFTKK